MPSFQGFPADTVLFLEDLAANNTREWFANNKERYESSFLKPSLEFIDALQKPLEKVAPLLKVEAKKSGGSLMRIYKDTRFSNNKTPYKVNIGIHFRHQAGKDVHAPGVYLHIQPSDFFLGVGMWQPASEPLKQIRAAMTEQPNEWHKAIRNKRFRDTFQLHRDDCLKSAPRGYDKDHPMIEDLRLKSILGNHKLTKKQIESADLIAEIPKLVKIAAPLMTFLCAAVNQPY